MNNSTHKFTHPSTWNISTYIAIFLAVGGILASSLWIFSTYSYWIDELYSVTAGNETFSSLYSLILWDVHPPLYQLLLKVWILAFGDNEPTTRFLSWIFANAAAFYFYKSTLRYGKLFAMVAILFFLTNTLFAYYSNETRSYAMTLLFTTILAVNYPSNKSNPSLTFFVACILLSLTHYFGLILAGVALAICFLQNIKHPRSLLFIFITGLICLLWPIYHMVYGEILNKTNGNFWIQVNGIFSTLELAASGYLPKTGQLGGVILILGLLSAIALALNSKPKADNNLNSVVSMTLNSSLILFIFIGLIAIIDIWSPMSTSRNYIVLLPFLGISIAGVITILSNQYPSHSKKILAVFFLFCALSLIKSFHVVHKKSTAKEDWRGASLYLIKNHQDKSIYHTSASENDAWLHLIFNFYLKKFSDGSIEATPYVLDKTVLDKPAAILFGHDNIMADEIERKMTEIGAKQSYKSNTPIEIKNESVGVYLVE